MPGMPNPDPFSVFLHATSYWRAASTLTRGLKLPYPYTMPMFVLEAFALELHLKCLLRLRGQLIDPTHEPVELFAKLTPADQQLVISKAKRSQADTDSVDVQAALIRSTGVFKKLRYLYEGHDWKVEDGMAGNVGVYETIIGIRLTILDANPKWKEDYKRILGDDGSDDTTHMPESLNAITILQIVPPST